MGFFDSFQPEKWAQLGTSLGLTPFRPVESYAPGMCFRRVERTRGFPAQGEAPTFQHWLWGKRRGVDVVVLQYETGSGSSSTTWTACIAPIDPPLYLGLEVSSENFFTRLFGGEDITVGLPEADNKLRIKSYDPARAALLLSPADEAGRNLLHHLVGLTRAFTTVVTDSLVEVACTGINSDPVRIAAMLDPAIDLAGWLAGRRYLVPPSPAEQAQQREWQRFADASGLRFDPHRMTLWGARDGTELQVALEIERQAPFTSLGARFPSPAPTAFRITRTATPNFLQGIFGQDIQVGDRAFDSAFNVVGQDDERIRRLLSKPALLQAMTLAASLTREVQVGDQGLFMRVGGSSPRGENLDTLVSLACTVSRELVGGPADPGPYR